MQVRDRIREFRRVKASELRPHPRNWRTHPPEQQDALRGVLAEIGYADALIARQLDDGTLELIDGHLRAETTPDVEVPVLIVDLSADEAAKLLVVHDPLAAMAGTNAHLLNELLAEVDTQNEAVRAMLDSLAQKTESITTTDEPPEIDLKPQFQVVVECADETEQQTVYERLHGEGYACRVLTL
jgi:ParB-like chromosome segregation protein Spo0J